MFNLAAKIRAASKPVYASVNEAAFSSAYLLASAAQKVFAPEPGMLGSVGVRMLHVDQSQADAKRGYVYTPIFAGSRKNDMNSHAPLASEALASAQRKIDHIYAMFVDAVAGHRGLHADAVRKTEADVFHAGYAVQLGLADGVAGFDETVRMMTEAAHAAPLATFAVRESAQLKQETLMNQEAKKEDAAPIVASAEQLAAERTSGMKSATERVKAVLTCEAAKDRPSLAQHLAFDTELSAEQAQALLAKAAPEAKAATVNQLAAAMSGIQNPNVGADVETVDEEAEAVKQILTAGKRPRLVS